MANLKSAKSVEGPEAEIQLDEAAYDRGVLESLGKVLGDLRKELEEEERLLREKKQAYWEIYDKEGPLPINFSKMWPTPSKRLDELREQVEQAESSYNDFARYCAGKIASTQVLDFNQKDHEMKRTILLSSINWHSSWEKDALYFFVFDTGVVFCKTNKEGRFETLQAFSLNEGYKKHDELAGMGREVKKIFQTGRELKYL